MISPVWHGDEGQLGQSLALRHGVHTGVRQAQRPRPGCLPKRPTPPQASIEHRRLQAPRACLRPRPPLLAQGPAGSGTSRSTSLCDPPLYQRKMGALRRRRPRSFRASGNVANAVMRASNYRSRGFGYLATLRESSVAEHWAEITLQQHLFEQFRNVRWQGAYSTERDGPVGGAHRGPDILSASFGSWSECVELFGPRLIDGHWV